MKHQEVMELMQRYLDKDLTQEEIFVLKDYLKQDSESMEIFERMQSLSNDLAQLPKVNPPHSIVDSILPKLDDIDVQINEDPTPSAPPKRLSWFGRMRNKASFPALGGTIAAAAVLGLLIFNFNDLPANLQYAGDSNTAESTSFNANYSADDTADGGATGSEGLMEKMSITMESSDDSGVVDPARPETNDNMDTKSTNFTAEKSPDDGTARIHSDASDHAVTSDGSANDIQSPSGEYTAAIHELQGQFHVLIRDSEDRVVYDSQPISADSKVRVEWTDVEELTFEWSFQERNLSVSIKINE